jgi:hypothetical protein
MPGGKALSQYSLRYPFSKVYDKENELTCYSTLFHTD